MKKSLLLIFAFLLALTAYSAEPQVKFYLEDGSVKSYNLSDIDTLTFTNKTEKSQMVIHYQKTKEAYYPPYLIDKIKFAKDSSKNDIFSVYISGFPKNYFVAEIDSVIFYKTEYPAITIGTQVWMTKNLEVDHYRNGDSIPEVRNDSKWVYLATGAWCYYNNDPVDGRNYGKLYNCYTVNDPRGLAPTGWHIPRDAEWTELTNYLGGESIAGTGGKMKETGTTHWLSPNAGATNESGFSALPGGWRLDDGGSFIDFGGYGSWWSSTEISTYFAWFRDLYNYNVYISRNHHGKGNGYSVRLIKD